MSDVEFDLVVSTSEVDLTVLDSEIGVGFGDAEVVALLVEGPPGPAGPPGDGTPVVGEVLSGVKDGVNAVFTTESGYRTGTTAVYRNGLREVRGVGYTESGPATVSFTTAPLSTDDISIDYVIS